MKGLALNKRFYEKIVKPIIEKNFNVPYACGLLGPGSEVLGIDDLTSRDHNWGLRLFLFIRETDQKLKDEISDILSKKLIPEFEGHFTNWSEPAEDGSRSPIEPIGRINHRILIYTPQEFVQLHFGVPDLEEISDEQWLLFSEQKLLEFTSGEIFHDSVGEITALRERVKYYPDHIKYVLLIGEWQAIASEIAFSGRTRMLYDEIGSHLITCRLINRIMRIAFILENHYIPYAKWFGSQFIYLKLARELQPILQNIISDADWETRENGLLKCYLILADKMKVEGLLDIEIQEEIYFDRPIKVINVWDLIANLKTKIDSLLVKKYNWGSINQIIPISDTIDDKMYLINLFQNLKLHN